MLAGELRKALADKNMDSVGLKADLIRKCKARNIAHTKVVRKIKKEDRYEKPKGVSRFCGSERTSTRIYQR